MLKLSGLKSVLLAVSGILAIALFLSASPAPPIPQEARPASQEIALQLDPAQTKVHFSVDSSLHNVHGTFLLKSGAVHFDPETGKAAGEILVLATSGDSSNNSRDQRMHKEILESAKFPDVVFRPSQIEGQVARNGASDVKLHGVILVRGHEHEIVTNVHAELAADHWKGTATFDVPYIQWGIKDPSNWLLKVKPIVNIQVDMAGPAKIAN